MKENLKDYGYESKEELAMHLEALQKHADIFNDIDWEMTPEDAVTRYLE